MVVYAKYLLLHFGQIILTQLVKNFSQTTIIKSTYGPVRNEYSFYWALKKVTVLRAVPLVQILFMHFSEKNSQIIGPRHPFWGWRPYWEIFDPPLKTPFVCIITLKLPISECHVGVSLPAVRRQSKKLKPRKTNLKITAFPFLVIAENPYFPGKQQV